MIKKTFISLAVVIVLGASSATDTDSADWPMWRYDAGRTASAEMGLPKTLHQQWVRHYSQREPVWDDPLNQDLMPYDMIFEPIVLGKRMFVNFNDTDRLLALDTETGQELWSYYTDGPVRLPAAAANGKVYFVSDDGYLYCVRAEDGQLEWKFRGGPSERKIIGNRRLISTWPARGGPVLRDGVVYFAASIWPFMGTFIYALDAETGSVVWANDGTGAQYLNQPHNYPAFAGVAPQGPLAATRDSLVVPGGRSIPACFDRETGAFRYFHLAPYGKSGGSAVFATDTFFFGHEREDEFSLFDLKTGDRDNTVRGVRPVADTDAFYFSGESIVKRLHSVPGTSVWKMVGDATGDLIKAGSRLYAAGKDSITALQLREGNKLPEVAWKMEVEGPVERLLAADKKLFAVTRDGRILAFGAEQPSGESAQLRDEARESTASASAAEQAKRILESTGVTSGYALVYGAGDGGLLNALAEHSELHLVGVDPDSEKVDRLRQSFTQSGLYGSRIALHAGDLETFQPPPYLSSLTIINGSESASELLQAPLLEQVYHNLRPYGGAIWLVEPGQDGELARAVETAGLENAEVTVQPDHALLRRVGPLPGAGKWTHQYGNIANTVKSGDQRVRLPLGLLWFGGSSNMDVLPRHGHGPPEQIIGGRLFIQGMDSLSARDVYTGRVLWKVKLEGLNTFGVFYDETYENTPTDTKYNQVHIPGSNARGTNFVATLDRVYIIEGNVCRVFDSATGEDLGTIALPKSDDGREASGWGYIGVYEDALIAGTDFANYRTKFGIEQPEKDSRSKWRFVDYERTGSDGLAVMDRFSGDVRWRVDARYGFIHNAVIGGRGMIFCLDKLPPLLERRNERRGKTSPDDFRLLALDAQTGQIKWEHNENVFGTWLGYSEEHDLLLQSTRPSGDTVYGENGQRMIVYEASTGEVRWDKEIRYSTPPILHHDRIITGGKMYNLQTGDVMHREDPLTGETVEWSYVSTKGCNYPIASENLITFRSSAAAFYDLTGDGGTGHFGGFKSGCTSNLIAADGVLNAPDYTRTCSCSFQNQTSLALVHMPELELWTHNDFDYSFERVRQVGINLGAPGDRRDSTGTLWLEHPRVGGPSPGVHVKVDGDASYFLRHSFRIVGDDTKWVAASGVEGARTITVRLAPNELHRLEAGVTVAQAEDDGHEGGRGRVDLSGSTLMIGTKKNDEETENKKDANEKDADQDPEKLDVVGLRFSSLPIAPGSTISGAYMQFKADERAFEPARFSIWAEAADDARPFSGDQFDFSGRPRTTTSVDWQSPLWPEKRVAGLEQRTPDIAPLLQEIVDRPGWKKGGSVALFLKGEGQREVDSFDGDRGKGTALVVFVQEPPELAESRRDAPKVAYTVRLHFIEPDDSTKPGDRVFDVALQGQTMLPGFDVTAAAGGAFHTVVREFTGIPVAEELTITLSPKAERPPVLCGVELIAE